MERDPFYAEFLPHMGLRYFTAAIFEHTPEKLAAVHVQRTRKQGHVDKREIALMRRLCPHYPHYHRAYATERRVSLNTVYSHLKQIREKTGCKSVPELIRKFGEWNVPSAELISADQCTALHTRNIPPNSTTASRIAV
jgi:DNA-binding CsgD family transcriptional regulator